MRTMARGVALLMVRPSISTLPAAGRISPEMTRNVVDFPAPFAPMSATICLSLTVSDIPRSAVIWPYRATRSRTSRMAPFWTAVSRSGASPRGTVGQPTLPRYASITRSLR